MVVTVEVVVGIAGSFDCSGREEDGHGHVGGRVTADSTDSTISVPFLVPVLVSVLVLVDVLHVVTVVVWRLGTSSSSLLTPLVVVGLNTDESCTENRVSIEHKDVGFVILEVMEQKNMKCPLTASGTRDC